MSSSSASDEFRKAASELPFDPDISWSTPAGRPPLRYRGAIFAGFDSDSSSLVVKLSAARVEELIEGGVGTGWGAAGRAFREWVAISPAFATTWPSLMREALAFGQSLPRNRRRG